MDGTGEPTPDVREFQTRPQGPSPAHGDSKPLTFPGRLPRPGPHGSFSLLLLQPTPCGRCRPGFRFALRSRGFELRSWEKNRGSAPGGVAGVQVPEGEEATSGPGGAAVGRRAARVGGGGGPGRWALGLGRPPHSSAEEDAGLSSSDIGANEHLMFILEYSMDATSL